MKDLQTKTLAGIESCLLFHFAAIFLAFHRVISKLRWDKLSNLMNAPKYLTSLVVTSIPWRCVLTCDFRSKMTVLLTFSEKTCVFTNKLNMQNDCRNLCHVFQKESSIISIHRTRIQWKCPPGKVAMML